jgi:hypothetical protein
MDTRTSRPRSAWLLSLARLLIALIGLAVLAVGARNAWKSETATAPLVVGVFLIALALILGPDLAEVSGRYKEAEFRLIRRGRALNLAGAVQTIAAEVTDVTIQGQLQELATELAKPEQLAAEGPIAGERALPAVIRRLRDALLPESGRTEEDESPPLPDVDPDQARTLYFQEVRGRYLSTWFEYSEASPIQNTPPKPLYRYLASREEGDGSVRRRIYIAFRWWGDWRIRCEVIAPSATSASQVIEGSIFMQGNNFSVLYPEYFPSAPPLEPGEYTFAWSRIDSGYPVRQSPPGLRRDVVVLAPELFEAEQESVVASSDERGHGDLEVRRDETPFLI